MAIKKTPIPPKTSYARSPDNSQFAPVSTSAPSQSISVAGAVSGTTPATIQSTPAPKPPSTQAAPVPTVVLPTPDLNSQSTQTLSQISSVASQITPVQVPAALSTQTSDLVLCASVEPTPFIQTAPPACIPASAIPVSAPAQVCTPAQVPATDQSSTTLPTDGSSGPPTAQKTVDPHTTVAPVPLPHVPPTSTSPSSGPPHAPPPDLPPSSLNPSVPQPCETAMPASGKFCLMKFLDL